MFLVGKYTKENGKIIKNMDMENLFGKMVVHILVNGMKINVMGNVFLQMRKEKDMKVNTIMSKNMGMVKKHMLMEACIMVNINMISNMGKGFLLT